MGYSCPMRASTSLMAALALALWFPAANAAGTPDERAAAYQEYRTAFDRGDYKTALPVAARIVEMTKSQFGVDEPEMANPLTNLATTYYRMKEYGEALDNYRAAVTVLELENNATDARLVRPLQGMGSALLGLQRPDEAVIPLKRALDIIRNRDGLHAPAQLPVLKTLISGYADTGRMADAGREQEYAYSVAESAYGKKDVRMLGPIEDLARWYEKTERYTAARLLHTRAVQIAEAKKPDGIESVPGLRGIARCFRLAYVYGETQESVQSAAQAFPDVFDGGALSGALAAPSGDGERALRLALQRLGTDPANAALRGAVQVDLGDWYMTANKTSRALDTWREGLKELTAAGDTSLLDQPVPLVYAAPAVAVSRRQRDPDDHSEQQVDIRLDIETNGRVRGLSVANPAPERESAEKAVLAALRQSLWRPAFRAGMPVSLSDFVFHEKVYVKLPKPTG
jgi:tetratricopeptide (TPR) repeat protein